MEDRDMLVVIIIAGVVGACCLGVVLYKAFVLYRKYTLARGLSSTHKLWRSSYTPNLRGNLVKTFSTPIEEDFYIDTDQELGKGGCGVVVVGEHKETHAQYAIKIVDKRTAEGGRLDRELKLLKDVDHTNIVRLFSVYDVPGHMYFVMELCLGGHLGNLLSRQPNRCVDEEWGKKLCKQLLSAIVHIHGRGIAHRDIKLQNVSEGEWGTCGGATFVYQYSCLRRANPALSPFLLLDFLPRPSSLLVLY
jgi:hypothetical protein